MCGIVGYVGSKKNAGIIAFEGLKKLEYRGYDSWGIAVKPLDKKRIFVKKHVGRIGKAKVASPQANIAIGHTRWATHGGVTDKNAHPHLDCQEQIAVIHNGIVENFRQLKDKLLKKGHIFRSETDTEVIAHLIEEKRKTRPVERAVFETFKNLVGSNAVCVLDLLEEKIIACRDGSPLVAGMAKGEYFLASDVTPFLKVTNKALFIKDGEGVVLSRKGVEVYCLENYRKRKAKVKLIDWKVEDVQKGGYPHFLLKEIIEQKKTIAKTAHLNEDQIRKISKEIKSGKKVYLTACGTAFYCCLAAKYFFAQAGIESEALGAYEFLPFIDFCNKKSLLIAVSQSGETADTLITSKAAQLKGARLIAIVNAVGSTLERIADNVLSIGAGPEIAVVSTKAFTSQLATLYLLSQAVKGKYQQARKQIKETGRVLERWLTTRPQNQMMALAKTLVDAQDIYLIGKHINYPGALECALKIKETSYIHSEAFASGELKHGVISLVQKGSPCIVLVSRDDVKDEVLSSAMEMKARGARIIGFAPFQAEEFDEHIKTPELGELTMIGNVIAGQLLGYYLGVGRGADPDKPRNLAKSVTVK